MMKGFIEIQFTLIFIHLVKKFFSPFFFAFLSDSLYVLKALPFICEALLMQARYVCRVFGAIDYPSRITISGISYHGPLWRIFPLGAPLTHFFTAIRAHNTHSLRASALFAIFFLQPDIDIYCRTRHLFMIIVP